MKKMLKDTFYRYIFILLFLYTIYLGINKEVSIFNDFRFLTGNFYYVFLLFFGGKVVNNLFVEDLNWKKIINERLFYLWLLSFSVLNLIIVISMKGSELKEFVDLSLVDYKSGVLFAAFFSKIYFYIGKIGVYAVFVPLFIFSFLVVFGKIIGYTVRFFIKLKKSDILKNYKANLIESKIRRRERRLNNELNKAKKIKKKKFEKLSKEIDQEEIKPKFSDLDESEEIIFEDSFNEEFEEKLDEDKYIYEIISEEGLEAENQENVNSLVEEDQNGEGNNLEKDSNLADEIGLEEEFELEEENNIDLEDENESDLEEMNVSDISYEEEFLVKEIDQEEEVQKIQELESEKKQEELEENLDDIEKNNSKGTFLFFHIFRKNEKKDKLKSLRKKRKEEEKQKAIERREKRRKLREELREKNLNKKEETFQNKEENFSEELFNFDKIEEKFQTKEEQVGEKIPENINFDELEEILELDKNLIIEAKELYYDQRIQSPKELAERLQISLTKATQLAIRLNNLKIGERNDTSI